MKSFFVCAISLMTLFTFSCEKEIVTPIQDEHTNGENHPPECDIATWDLSCFAVDETRTYSIDIPDAGRARWSITENEGAFEFVGDNNGTEITIKGVSGGTAVLNVNVSADNFACSSCKEVCL